MNKVDELLEPDWDEDSNVTNIINMPPVQAGTNPQVTPSQFEKLKEMKTGTKAGIGGAIIILVTSLVEIARRLGWF